MDVCDLVSARQQMEQLRTSEGSSFELHYANGLLALAEDRLDDAVEALQLATTLSPSADPTRLSSRAWQLLGESHGRKARKSGLMAQAGLAKKARSAFEKAVEVDPENLDVKRHLVEFYTRAPTFMGGGKDKAQLLITQIEERDPARGAEALGLHHRWAGRVDEALEAYDQALALRETWAVPHFEAAVALSAESRAEEASRRLEEALEADPGHRMAQFDLGSLAAAKPSALPETTLVNAASALESYLSQPACGEDPPHSEGHFLLARILEHQGSMEAATRNYERVLELEPGHKPATRALRRLKAARD